MVSHFCIASHAYSRSARAPLPKLLDTVLAMAAAAPWSHLLEPPPRHVPAHAPVPAPSPPTVVFFIISSAPARPGW
eukprot:2291713-Pleurochrysis_carterae.AAC.1